MKMLVAALLLTGCSAPLAEEAVPNLSAYGAVLHVPAGRCRAELDGEAVTLAQLKEAMRHRPEVPLTFQASPDAKYACVDRVFAVLRRAGAGNLGFIGNELIESDDPNQR